MRLLLALLLASIAFAGCLADDPDPPTDDDPTDDLDGDGTPDPYKVFGPQDGTMTAGVAVLGNGGQLGATTLDFTVPSGTSLLFVEVRWDDPVQDLDLELQTGANIGTTTWDYSNNNGAPGAPDSPHSITVTAPGPGDWVAGVFSNGPGADLDYELVATAFLGATSVPDGYTGFA